MGRAVADDLMYACFVLGTTASDSMFPVHSCCSLSVTSSSDGSDDDRQFSYDFSCIRMMTD